MGEGKKPSRSDASRVLTAFSASIIAETEKRKKIDADEQKATAGEFPTQRLKRRAQREKIAKIAPKRDRSGKAAGTVRKGVLMPRTKKKKKDGEVMPD